MNKTVTIIIVVALIAISGWYYYTNHSYEVPADHGPVQMPATIPSATTTGSMETGTVDTNVTVATGSEKDFTVSGFNFGFTPSTFTIKKGDHVKVTFTNSGGMHDFVIDEFNVKTPRINTGGNAVVEFNATKAGTFQYYCSVGNHRAMGMFGTLVVTE